MKSQQLHPVRSYTIRQWIVLFFGIGCYILVNGMLFYFIGFVANFGVPKSIDSGASTNLSLSIVINLSLLLLFGLQHSIMARQPFKKRIEKWIPPFLERSFFVLITVLVLALLVWQWQPLPELVWSVQSFWLRIVVYLIFVAGWTTMLIATYLIDHYELFGVRQVLLHLQGYRMLPHTFKTPFLYQHVRHPMMLGFLVGFWATPDMTLSHLIFSIGMSLYILVGIIYEEKDLLREFGRDYLRYQCLVPRLIPSIKTFSQKQHLLKKKNR
ncbi:MAG: methanethiol S-methyltransferase [Bacteroidota bacterium]